MLCYLIVMGLMLVAGIGFHVYWTLYGDHSIRIVTYDDEHYRG